MLELPLVVGFEEHGADQSDDGPFVGEDTDDVGSPLDLLLYPGPISQRLHRVSCTSLTFMTMWRT
jgi:hypothetical protein